MVKLKKKIIIREEIYCSKYWCYVSPNICVLTECEHFKGEYEATGYIDCTHDPCQTCAYNPCESIVKIACINKNYNKWEDREHKKILDKILKSVL